MSGSRLSIPRGASLVSPWSTPGLVILAILITFAVTAGPIALAGANPIEAYAEFLIVPLTSRFGVLEVLVAATPIMLTGAAVALAFRGGYWNIGAEGQLLVGAIAAAAIGQVAGLPQVVAVPLMIAGGAAGGALWALGPAVLRVRFGIDEVVTTLLLNPVALLLVNALLHGPWRDPVSGFPESPRIVETAEFPQLLDRSRLHLGFLVAIVVVVAVGYVVSRTPAGLRLRAVGLSPHGARFAGIDVSRTLLITALVSGAIAGIAGVGEVAGIQYRLTSGISPGYGYTGIVVATLGTLTMPGVALAALFLGDLSVGASSAGRALGIPSQLGAVVQGTLLLTTIALLAVRRNRAAGAISPEAAGEVADSVASDVVVGDAIQDDEEARA
ncbi:MAG TPA: ABC transporter permease [Candidatus Limnocylindrales bacterium]|nr:ABC transporter permease [Candidatus Limnocylindrales bacterium]